jgi:hypothetical protein
MTNVRRTSTRRWSVPPGILNSTMHSCQNLLQEVDHLEKTYVRLLRFPKQLIVYLCSQPRRQKISQRSRTNLQRSKIFCSRTRTSHSLPTKVDLYVDIRSVDSIIILLPCTPSTLQDQLSLVDCWLHCCILLLTCKTNGSPQVEELSASAHASCRPGEELVPTRQTCGVLQCQ